MDLADHLRVIAQSWWRILFVSLLVAASVYFFSSRRPDVYESTATMSVSAGTTTGGGGSTKDQSVFLAQTYAELALAQPVIAAAIKDVGLDIDPETAKRRLAVTTATDIAFITITAQGPTPFAASALANGLAEELKAAVKDQQAEAITKDLASVNEEIASIQTQLNQSAADAPERGALEARYTALLEAAVTRRTQPQASVDTVSEAEAPTAPMLPRPNRDALFAFIATFILTSELTVLLRAYGGRLPTTLDQESVTEAFGLPVLAMVPSESGALLVEAFRGLRTNLAAFPPGQRPRTVAIVSSQSNAGKSFTSLNLAMVAAGQPGGAVLVDADLRRPTLEDLFGIPRAPGLTDVLGGAALYGALYSVGVQAEYQADQQRFFALPSGTPVTDPAAVLSSSLLPRIERGFPELPGLMIFDTPPLSLFSDAIAIGSQCDAVILVLDAKRTKVRSTRNTITALEQGGARILGVVVNRVKAPTAPYGAYK